MKKPFLVALAVSLLTVGSIAAVRAFVSHPDSRTQSIEDGCNRSQLALLGEAAATMKAGPHPTGFASWVYVNGDRTPKTLEGAVVGTHTAGTDLFGVHDTYDVNFDVVPDAKYEELLSTRNAAEEPAGVGQIHTEWESGKAPLFAWPSPGDRVREMGSQIWDCGHWQDGEGTRIAGGKVSGQDNVPGDPFGTAGDKVPGQAAPLVEAKPAAGEEIEIHPIMELATWRAHGDFVPQGGVAAVHASQLDVAISNQGGKAKGIEECALLAPKHPVDGPARVAGNPTCSTLQDVTGRDYTYTLAPPGPRLSQSSRLLVQQDVHYSDNGPRSKSVRAKVKRDVVEITVPFSDVDAVKTLQDFGATWHAWWSDAAVPVHRFTVTSKKVTIYNNLDGDKGDTSGNPLISPEGEWNMFTDVGGQWTNLHDLRDGRTDYVPELGAVPSARPVPQVFSLTETQHPVPAAQLALPDGAALHLFTDARECDQPGYVDCPTQHGPGKAIEELAATGGSAGRGDIAIPVSQLVGHTTTVVLHPIVCGGPNDPPCSGEERNPRSTCGSTGCYDVTFQIDDADAAPTALVKQTITGDGTAKGAKLGLTPATALSWWLNPPTRYGLSEGEEQVHVARVVAGMRHAG